MCTCQLTKVLWFTHAVTQRCLRQFYANLKWVLKLSPSWIWQKTRCIKHLICFTACLVKGSMACCILRGMALKREGRITWFLLTQMEPGFQRRQFVLRKFWTTWTDTTQSWLYFSWTFVARGGCICFVFVHCTNNYWYIVRVVLPWALSVVKIK